MKPFLHPRQESSGAEPSDGPVLTSSSLVCDECPKSYAVCDYCRGLGLSGPRIFHFESDCWTKARHLEYEASRKLQDSLKKRKPLAATAKPTQRYSSNEQRPLLSGANLTPIPLQRVPYKAVIDLDDLFGDDDLIQHDDNPSGSFSSTPSRIDRPGASAADEGLPDLSAIDALLTVAGLR